MAKYEAKTVPTKASVAKFISAVGNETKRNDSLKLIEIMQEITGEEPTMWGPGIIGFGSYHYKYATGHEGDCCVTGFSPRKSDLTLYILAGFDKEAELLMKLGKHRAGKCCLYIKKLDDVHLPTLKKLIRESVKYISNKKWP